MSRIDGIKSKIEKLESIRIDRFALFVAAALTPADIDLSKAAESATEIQTEVQNRIDAKRKALLDEDQNSRTVWQKLSGKEPKMIKEDKLYSFDAGGLASSALKAPAARSAYREYLVESNKSEKREGLQEALMQFAYCHMDESGEKEMIQRLVDRMKIIEAPKDKKLNEKDLHVILESSILKAKEIRNDEEFLKFTNIEGAIDAKLVRYKFGPEDIEKFDLFVDGKVEDDKGKEEEYYVK
jgi:metal-responsive CopG/Arc/MetJ family transcriptional regulator